MKKTYSWDDDGSLLCWQESKTGFPEIRFSLNKEEVDQLFIIMLNRAKEKACFSQVSEYERDATEDGRHRDEE